MQEIPCVHCNRTNRNSQFRYDNQFVMYCGQCQEPTCYECWLKFHVKPHSMKVLSAHVA